MCNSAQSLWSVPRHKRNEGRAFRLTMGNGAYYETQDRLALAGPADGVIFLDGGVLLEDGLPEDVLVRPQNPRTQDFLRRILQS